MKPAKLGHRARVGRTTNPFGERAFLNYRPLPARARQGIKRKRRGVYCDVCGQTIARCQCERGNR